MDYKVLIGAGLIILYVFRLLQYPGDDPVLAHFVNAHTNTSANQQSAKSIWKLIVSTEPNSKNGFTTIQGKLISRCDAQNCEQIDSNSFVQMRIYDAQLQTTIENIADPEIKEIEPGNLLEVTGALKSLMTPTEDPKTKDYQNYLKKEKIFYEISGPKIISVLQSDAYRIVRSLVRIRKSIENQIKDILPRPESDLAQGLVVSGKGSMSEELLEHFKRVGLIHIVVLSGSNVSIISAALFAMLAKLPYLAKTIIGISGMTGFAIMTGAAPPVVRSVLMSSIPLLAGVFMRSKSGAHLKAKNKDKNLEKENEENNEKEHEEHAPQSRLFPEQNSSILLLLMTAMCMAIHNPLLPVFDVSFQLSFMATLGLMVLTKPIAHLLRFLPEKFSVREIVSSSVATQIYVAPLLLNIGGSLSTVFLLANIVVLPILPLIMFLIFALAFASYINSELASMIGTVTWLFLHSIIGGVQRLSSLSFAVVEVGQLTRKMTWSIHCILFASIPVMNFFSRHRKNLLHLKMIENKPNPG